MALAIGASLAQGRLAAAHPGCLRLNNEIKRRTDVVGIFPNEASIRRLVGAILMEQTEEWTVQRSRYMTLETLAPVCDDPIVSLPVAQTD